MNGGNVIWGYAVTFLLGAVLVSWPVFALGRVYQRDRTREFLWAVGQRLAVTLATIDDQFPHHFSEDDRAQAVHLVRVLQRGGPE